MLNFRISIHPRYSDLNGLSFGISILDPKDLSDPEGLYVNLSGVILANLKRKFQNYVYNCTTTTIVMKDGLSNELDYLADNTKIRKFLFTKILQRYNPLNEEIGHRRYLLQEHLIAK